MINFYLGLKFYFHYWIRSIIISIFSCNLSFEIVQKYLTECLVQSNELLSRTIHVVSNGFIVSTM